MEEGYIKFQCLRTEQTLSISDQILDEINEVRNQLLEYGMVGKIPHGPGFGNLSVRMADQTFLITGSDTGGFRSLKKCHFSLVTRVDLKNNKVWCSGEIDASSESMSHAMVYQADPQLNAAIHIHHHMLWKRGLNKLATTPRTVEYGTPELANAIKEFISFRQTAIVFGGHTDGLLFCGKELKETLQSIMNLYRSIG